jgi:hypothetical protein
MILLLELGSGWTLSIAAGSAPDWHGRWRAATSRPGAGCSGSIPAPIRRQRLADSVSFGQVPVQAAVGPGDAGGSPAVRQRHSLNKSDTREGLSGPAHGRSSASSPRRAAYRKSPSLTCNGAVGHQGIGQQDGGVLTGSSAGHVGPCARVVAQPGDHDPPQRAPAGHRPS